MSNQDGGIIKKKRPGVGPRQLKNTQGRVIHLLPDKFPPVVKDFYNRYRDVKISSMTVCRAPIPGAIEKLANIATLGSYEREKANRDIDRFFHLFMVISLDNGKRIIYEKNQRVALFETNKDVGQKEATCIPVPNASGVVFGDMIQKGIKFAGASHYFQYDMTSDNCQQFVYVNLQPSGMWNPTLATFVKQNVEKIIPTFLSKVMRGATNMAAFGERITGFKPSDRWTKGDPIKPSSVEPITEQQKIVEESAPPPEAKQGEGMTNEWWSEYMGRGVVSGRGVLSSSY